MDVIIYQEGQFVGLKWAMESVRVHSPRSKTIVIGSNIPDVDYLDHEPFLAGWREFEPHYEHFGPNQPEFEKRCLRRWFVIRDYLRTRDIGEVLCIDSDVLIFCDLFDLNEELKAIPFWSGHASIAWTFSRHGIEMFCKAIDWIYRHKESRAWKQMLADYHAHRRPVIGDMNMIDWFMSCRPKAPNLCDAFTRDNVFDQNICGTSQYMAHGDRKRITFWDGVPYAMTKRRTIVRMNSLHCWGRYKNLMGGIWTMSRETVGNPHPQPF